jgi:DNA-directed RNA polymerase specialized sigma24 family protein
MTVKDKKVAKQSGVIPPHRILREVLRHYTEFREMVGGYGQSGQGADGRKDTIDHSYWAIDEDGNRKKITIEISFWDLQEGLKELAPRKREAIWHNVIEDKKQKDVAKLMGITTVSVGQYVEAGVMQLAKRYFAEDIEVENDS